MAAPMPIDVIVPVYRGHAETRRCLDSVLASRPATPFELVVVDDASPDADITRLLDDLAAAGRVTLLRNGDNQGFVRSVNRGMALHPQRDVVLLNSDTEVANDWLDRLCAHAAATDVATVTPFSNNGTICSYPFEDWPGGVPGTLGLAALDRLCAEANRGRSVALPTAVGFCMYIRRACLAQVGLFDAERFGRGYGEENDFCLRASQAGWRHLLAADVFVFHAGGVSFSAERFRLQETALATLLAAYPDYLDRIGDFHGRDPVAPLRAAVDLARLARGGEERRQVVAEQLNRGDAASLRPTRLHVTHGWGGGIARWVADFCRAEPACRHLLLRSSSDRNHTGRWLELVEAGPGELVIQRWELATPIDGTAIDHPQYEAILTAVRETFAVGSLVVSSLIGHGLAALDTGLPTVVVLHDLYPFCPAVFAHFDIPCVDCPGEKLARCLARNPHNVFWHNSRADHWLALRQAHGRRLAQPWVSIVAPSRSVHDRWATLLPAMGELPWHCIGHGIDPGALAPVPAAVVAVAVAGRARPLRVVVPGRLPPHKGLFLVHGAAAALAGEVDFLLLGCGDFGASLADLAHVEIVADYDQAGLVAAVNRFRPDLALLPSVLPESFSYTLSEMFALGLPVLATRLGAFAERIEEGVSGFLVEPEVAALVARLRQLASNGDLVAAVRQRIAAQPVRDTAAMVRDYRVLLPEAPGPLRGAADRGLIEAARRRVELEAENARLAAEAAEWARQGAERDDWRRRADDLAGQLAACRHERDLILNSHSWTLTRPLRGLRRFLGRLLAASDRRNADRAATAAPVVATAPPPPLPPAVLLGGEAARRELRRRLDLPDAATVVLATGAPADTAAAAALVRLAADCAARRNDVVFLLSATTLDDPVWAEARAPLALLAATRRCFCGDQGFAPATLAEAVDVAVAADAAPPEWDQLSARLCPPVA